MMSQLHSYSISVSGWDCYCFSLIWNSNTHARTHAHTCSRWVKSLSSVCLTTQPLLKQSPDDCSPQLWQQWDWWRGHPTSTGRRSSPSWCGGLLALQSSWEAPVWLLLKVMPVTCVSSLETRITVHCRLHGHPRHPLMDRLHVLNVGWLELSGAQRFKLLSALTLMTHSQFSPACIMPLTFSSSSPQAVHTVHNAQTSVDICLRS